MKNFTTNSLSLAAALSLTFPIESVDKTDPRKAQFVFKMTPELDEQVNQFWRQEMRVDPLKYFDEIRNIKSRLYA